MISIAALLPCLTITAAPRVLLPAAGEVRLTCATGRGVALAAVLVWVEAAAEVVAGFDAAVLECLLELPPVRIRITATIAATTTTAPPARRIAPPRRELRRLGAGGLPP